jgi:hypothetical protein
MVISPVVPAIAIGNSIGAMMGPITGLPLGAAAALPGPNSGSRIVARAPGAIVAAGTYLFARAALARSDWSRIVSRTDLLAATSLTKPRVITRSNLLTCAALTGSACATGEIARVRSRTGARSGSATRGWWVVVQELTGGSTGNGASGNTGACCDSGTGTTRPRAGSRRSASTAA